MSSLIGRPVGVRASVVMFSAVVLLSVLLTISSASQAQASGHNPELISADSSGDRGNDNSENPSSSEDGRYIAFQSAATDLVTPDTNGGFKDIFVKDTQTGVVTLASTNADGVQANDHSLSPSISNDGRYVAFESAATNLIVPELTTLIEVADTHIYVKDLQTGEVVRASSTSAGVPGNNNSVRAALSGDGRHVAFHSYTWNLVSGDTNTEIDVFVKHLDTGLIERASVDGEDGEANGGSHEPSISDNGRYVAFQSDATGLLPPVASDLSRMIVASDNNSRRDIFVKDMDTGAVVLASKRSTGAQTAEHSYHPSISGNGRYVVFHTMDSAVSGDSNGVNDVFRRDLETNTTTRVSLDDGGAQHPDGGEFGDVSSQGRYVTFIRPEGGITSLNQFGTTHVHVIDTVTSQVVRLSESQAGVEGDGSSQDLGWSPPSISDDGRHVAFHTLATNIVSPDANFSRDIIKTFNTTWVPPVVSLWPRANDLNFGLWSKLAGTVVDGNGDPVANQKVWLQYLRPLDGPVVTRQIPGVWQWLQNVYTNENGYFQHWFYYEGGTRTYRAKEAKYEQSSNTTQIALQSNIGVWNNYRPVVRYCQWTKLHGKYGGAQGPNANTTLYLQRQEGSSWVWQATVQTDASGYYAAWAPICPTTNLRMGTAGSVVTSSVVTKTGSTINAWRNSEVHAVLKDGFGAGVPGISLYLQKWNGSAWTWQATCSTSSAGYCNFGSVNPSGTIRVANWGSRLTSD